MPSLSLPSLLSSLALAASAAGAVAAVAGDPLSSSAAVEPLVVGRLPPLWTMRANHPPAAPPTAASDVSLPAAPTLVGGTHDDPPGLDDPAAAADDDDDALVSDLLRWLRDGGAYVNPKLTVRRTVPGDPSSPRGVFAAEDLDEGETVCRIPWDLVVGPNYPDSSDPGVRGSDCGTIRAAERAMGGGNETMTPYGRYLAAQPRNYAPGFWSKGGLSMLADMLESDRPPEEHVTAYDELPPRLAWEYLAEEVEVPCGVDAEDPMQRHAAMIVKARADHDLLVPFYDMANHHNGRYNVRHVVDPYSPDRGSADGYEIETSQPVRAGEQIHNSYNQCNVCSENYDWFGTPELFLVYGFVEPYPRRWLFDFARTSFDVVWKDGDASSGPRLEVDFRVPPSRRGTDLLAEELAHLDDFASKHRNGTTYEYEGDPVREQEWESLWRYHDALREALHLAVHSDVARSDDVWERDDDWWVRDGTLTSEDFRGEGWVLPTINA